VKRYVSCVAVVAIMAGAAGAADLQRPVYAAPYSWAGFYLGAHAGYGFASADASVIAGGTTFSASQDLDGGIAGLQLGANSQLGPLVLGWEADYSRSWQRKRYDAAVPGVSVSVTNEIPWLATLRGRAGFALDQWLVYATGGLAITGLDVNGSATVAGTTTALSAFEPQAAFVLGGGIETALWSSNLTARIEYLHVQSIDLADVTSGITTRSSASNSIWRLGVNYRFGGGK